MDEKMKKKRKVPKIPLLDSQIVDGLIELMAAHRFLCTLGGTWQHRSNTNAAREWIGAHVEYRSYRRSLIEVSDEAQTPAREDSASKP